MRDDFADRVIAHEPVLRGYALSLTRDSVDAQDLLQDTYARALRYRESFAPGTNLGAWLRSIMRNTFINGYRQRQRRKTDTVFTQEERYAELQGQTTRNGGERALAERDMLAAIARLPRDLREPFLLHYEGHKYSEIAERERTPIGTVKTRIHAARKSLKKDLRAYGVDRAA